MEELRERIAHKLYSLHHSDADPPWDETDEEMGEESYDDADAILVAIRPYVLFLDEECCCPHHDARICMEIRHPEHGIDNHLIDGSPNVCFAFAEEKCQCACHDDQEAERDRLRNALAIAKKCIRDMVRMSSGLCGPTLYEEREDKALREIRRSLRE